MKYLGNIIGFKAPFCLGGHGDILYFGRMISILATTLWMCLKVGYIPSGSGSQAMTFPGIHPKIAGNSERSSHQIGFHDGIDGIDPSYLHQIDG